MKGSRKYWIIAIVFGLLASYFSYRYLEEVKIRYQPDDLIQVVKAAKDISKDTIIANDDVAVEHIPAKYTHPDSIRKKSDLIGKIATADVIAGQIIMKNNIVSDRDSAERLSYIVPQGKRAVSIPVDNISGVSGYIEVGDRVDIITTVDIPVIDEQGYEKNRAYSILTLQDIEVLAIGSNQKMSDKKPEPLKTITVSVSVSDTQRLVLASERGTLRLLLRSPVDESTYNLAPMKLRDFITE